MLRNIKCTIPANEIRQTNKTVNKFIQSILEEDRRVKELRAQEIQSTAENPRIKAENETFDISTELKQNKRERFLEVKRCQQLRENSEELRQLQMQVQAAYVSKSLAEQKAERDRHKQNQIKIKRQEDAEIEKERKKCRELEKQNEEIERRQKERFRGVLQGQMAEALVKQAQEYQEILKDREHMKNELRKIEAAKAQEAEEFRIRREQTRQDMHDFLISQQLFKQQEHQQKVDDNEVFLKFMQQRDAENKRREDMKRMDLERRQECSEKIGQQLYSLENEKRKRENLLLDLLVEERKAKEDMRFRQNAEKQYMEHSYARNELERYRENTHRLKVTMEKDEEALLNQHQMRFIVEQDKKQNMLKEEHRRKIDAHRKALLEIIEERRLQRAKNMSEVMQEYEILLKQQRERQELIEKERLRILKEQPVEILRFLPAGVLRESDREVLHLSTRKAKK